MGLGLQPRTRVTLGLSVEILGMTDREEAGTDISSEVFGNAKLKSNSSSFVIYGLCTFAVKLTNKECEIKVK